MNQPPSNNSFVFSDAFNGEYIIELYAGDYIMIEETFGDVLKEYDVFIETINSCYEKKELSALKSAIHKVKPLFGFVGLTSLQSQCRQFEQTCERGGYPPADDFTSLKTNMVEAKFVIESEKNRLALFNQLHQ
jgi:HPt (histidine-containing phosphotransfer) domain-containing protein